MLRQKRRNKKVGVWGGAAESVTCLQAAPPQYCLLSLDRLFFLTNSEPE